MLVSITASLTSYSARSAACQKSSLIEKFPPWSQSAIRGFPIVKGCALRAAGAPAFTTPTNWPACASERFWKPLRLTSNDRRSVGVQSARTRPKTLSVLPSRSPGRLALICHGSAYSLRTAARTRKVLLSGPLTKALAVTDEKRPTERSKPAFKVSMGFAAMKLIAPPVEFCPNRVPCGPFKTSTRAISRLVPSVITE